MFTALVTGGSAGVGKGVVEGLAEAGFDVYFTGRNPERLAAVEAEAGLLGGRVTACGVDHRDDEQVRSLFDRLPGLDLLVNSAWGGYENMVEGEAFTWSDPYWKQPLWRWDAMIQVGVRSAYIASQLATQRMIENGRGLIVNLSYWAAQKHMGNVVYGMSKAATDKMTRDMAAELRTAQLAGIHVVSVYPGLVRTERVMENAHLMDMTNSESPRFIGRVIAALMGDAPKRLECHGQVVVAAELARHLGVTDIDGATPLPKDLHAQPDY